jgi:hypothetical protein
MGKGFAFLGGFLILTDLIYDVKLVYYYRHKQTYLVTKIPLAAIGVPLVVIGGIMQYYR